MPAFRIGSEKLEPANPPTASASETMIEILIPGSPWGAAYSASDRGTICIRRWRFVFSLTAPR